MHCIYPLLEECRPYVLVSNVMAYIIKEAIGFGKSARLKKGGGEKVAKAFLAMPV